MRALLAFLLLHANEPVSSDRLIDEVWGPTPPKTAGASLQNYVSRLRKAIGADLLVSQPAGYVLRVDPERFDLARFERLTAEAQGAEPRERAEKLRAALALWRGPALEDLAFEPFARDEVGRLEEARLAALEQRIGAELELGAAGELVGELEQLASEHPLREPFRRQLMLALYRAGRQADALEAYQDARHVLMDELGLEPSEELRALQQAILQQDASLGGAGVPDVTERGPDRRTVTVLFCDLVDSTRLALDLDPEVYRQLISRYFELVREPIAAHGGTIEKFIGDAVMAVFGVPQLHEDDALRAVRAAVDIQAALRNEEWQVPVAARVGLSTGEVHVLSAAGADLHVSGAVASAAAQLEEHAPPGGILIGDETHRLVRDAVRAGRVGDAWRLDDLLENAPAYARRLDTPLVGRDQELERLRVAYANTLSERHCRVVTVVGEAGIGKTRLAQELVSSVDDEARVLVGRCISYGEGATYLPIAEVVRQAVEEHSVAGIRKLVEGEDDADAVAQRVAELTGVAESPAAPGEAFWAVRRLLESISRERPVLVILDDIHWAEPTLLDLVEYLGEWAKGQILLLCLARGDLLEQRSGWGGPTSTGFLVQLEPLPADELGKLVGQLGDEPVDPQVQDHIVEHSGGNPLFAEQLLALAGEAPNLALEQPPATVEALLASRLDRLGLRELELLRRAAVVGRHFSPIELGDLAPQEDAMRLLLTLAERGLIHPVERDLYRFHHVLVREVAYRGIPKSQRAELHESAARGLDRRDEADELVGYHFEQAFFYATEVGQADEHARGLADAAGERLGRAGIRAWKRADAPAGVALLVRACNLLEADDETRRELLCELGTALRMRGELERAEEVLQEAAVASAAAGDNRLELRANLELGNVRTWQDPSEAPALLELVRTAIPVFESHTDDRALGRAWLVLGTVRGGLYCDNAEWEDAATRAMHHYRKSGWSPSTCLGAIASALFYGPKPVEAAVARCDELLRDVVGDRASEANVLAYLGGIEAMRGRFEVARELVSRARLIYEELGQVVALVTCGEVEASVEMLAGRPDVAERALRQACEICERLHESGLLASRAPQLADVLYATGSYDEAEIWIGRAEEHAGSEDIDAQSSWRSVAAKLTARRGDFAKALQVAEEAVELVQATDALNHRAKVLVDYSEVMARAGRDDEATQRIDQALELYELKGNLVAAGRVRAQLTASLST